MVLSGKAFDVICFIESLSDFQHGQQLICKLAKIGYVVRVIAPTNMSWLSDAFVAKGISGGLDFDFYNGGFDRALKLGLAKAKLLITSCPDLGKYGFIKSRSVDTYCYFFHSVSSTHTCYTRSAFKNFDLIFAAGPHQKAELKIAEEKYGWRKKLLKALGLCALICNERSSKTFAPVLKAKAFCWRQLGGHRLSLAALNR